MLPRRGERYAAADVEVAIADSWPESATLEYKADPATQPEDRRHLTHEQKIEIAVVRAVCAFANAGGGTLVLGVGEKAGVPYATTPPGLPRVLGRVTADERIALMISRGIEPHVACRVEPVPIDDERTYVIADVAPRGGGPHRIVNASDPKLNERYYVRRGRESVQADHYELRALFAEAEEEGQRVREYLAKQELLDDRDDNARFGHHDPAHQLSQEQGKRASAVLIATLIPEVLRGEIVNVDDETVRRILNPGRAGWLEQRPTLEGRLLFRPGSPPLLTSYLHVHRNGYIEAGDARVFAWPSDGKRVFPHAINEILTAALAVGSELYSTVGVRDRIRLDLHLRDVQDTRLAVRGDDYVDGYNTTTHLTITELVSVDDLKAPAMAARFDRRLANAYGLESGLVFDDEGRRRSALAFG